ncbi:MAG: 8-amino-7-oxononanoate synthase [Candidatus Omnitrophica bacterium]|nr:8-amino-7-oxononanoate synthase [Candidatus Omnitrophota bacterium]
MNTNLINRTLVELESKGLRRSFRNVSGKQSRRILIDGKDVLNFCSNNYLGLADDVRLCDAAEQSLENQGFGSGASRLVCGNFDVHRQLEKTIAQFKGSEDCLVFSTGYMANVGILSSVCTREDVVFSDRLNHASIVDGIVLSRAAFKRYPHRDMDILEKRLQEAKGYRKRLIVTDSVFSMDGDIAPLDKIVFLAKKHDALVMVDEAHSFGVLGKQGKGLAEHFGVEKEIDIQMGTLSKAAGSFGAYCCGAKEMIQFFMNKAHSFIYTTAMPPSVAAASIKAIEIIQSEPQRRSLVLGHSQRLRKELKQMGFDTLDSCTPIIPIIVKDESLALRFSQKLFDAGIFIQAIRPPTVPAKTARLRVTVTASHTKEDIDFVIETLQRIGKELCLIS